MKVKTIAEKVVSKWHDEEVDDIANDVKKIKELHEDLTLLKGVANSLRSLEKEICERRYSQRVESRLRGDNKDTGTVTFTEEDFSVKATVKKAVTWDTNTLWEALDKVEKDFGSEVAKNISDITVKVPENKYKDADPRIQLILEESRTVEAKGPDYYISVEEKPCD
tara:strand:+ start:8183 stop:8680 length:498 start_codon:yes stop_codon:yes gene_type:complete